MENDKSWMLITYYCPTHGNGARIEPFEVTRDQISKFSLKKEKQKKFNKSE